MQCATSSAAGPVDVSTQSTTPLTTSPSQSTLPGWKSRCRNVGSYAGGSSSSTANARRQSAGCSVHSGTMRFPGQAQDW